MQIQDRIRHFARMTPAVPKGAYVAPGAALIGDVSLGENVSVWFQAAIRADLNSVRIGARSNVQDGAVIHVSDDFPTIVGERVTIGHGAVLHACSIGDEVLVGMNAVVLDGAVIESRCIIGANALVTAGTHIPSGSLFLGSPGKVRRTLSLAEQEALASWAERYVVLSKAYLNGEPGLFLPSLPPVPNF